MKKNGTILATIETNRYGLIAEIVQGIFDDIEGLFDGRRDGVPGRSEIVDSVSDGGKVGFAHYRLMYLGVSVTRGVRRDDAKSLEMLLCGRS